MSRRYFFGREQRSSHSTKTGIQPAAEEGIDWRQFSTTRSEIRSDISHPAPPDAVVPTRRRRPGWEESHNEAHERHAFLKTLSESELRQRIERGEIDPHAMVGTAPILFFAIDRLMVEVVMALLARGASPWETNMNRISALAVAKNIAAALAVPSPYDDGEESAAKASVIAELLRAAAARLGRRS
jgi:hypothetical protein